MRWKGQTMWIFDGEEWTEEGGGSSRTESPHRVAPHFDQFQPELQVLEIVPVPAQPNYIPLPLL
jgi:hypothetical protein